MQSIDFKPETYFRSYSFYLCCGSLFNTIETKDRTETIRRKMNDWISKNIDRITIINIETFDFKTPEWIMEQSHFRIWYKSNNQLVN